MLTNPWLLLGVGLIWLASLVGVGVWQRSDGATTERTMWVERENAELVAANAKIVQLNAAARAQEVRHAESLAAISTGHQQEIKNAQAQANADRAAVRAGGLRLYDVAAPGLRACGSLSGAPGATAGGRDGPKGGELSGAAAEFLLELVNDADAVARQLAACQQVVRADREVR